jgi:nitronate monooxygenase
MHRWHSAEYHVRVRVGQSFRPVGAVTCPGANVWTSFRAACIVCRPPVWGDMPMLPQDLRDHLRLPVIASPMFLVSGPDLVLASCRAGVLGTVPALNQRTSEGFEDWLVRIDAGIRLMRQTTPDRKVAPYGVNLIVHRSNARLEADLEVCAKHRVPLIITSLGAVPELVAKVHAYGGRVFHDVINARHAKKAMDAGVDGLILVAAGAGGHAGTTSPFALVDEIRRFFPGTLCLAGSISDGRGVAAAQMMGADLAYMGTRFIATRESAADEAYKRMILDASAADVVYTPAVSGVHGNFLRESLVRAGLDPERMPAEKPKMDFGDEREAKAWRDIWSAGHGVGGITDVPATGELVDRLEAEYRAAIARFGAEAY